MLPKNNTLESQNRHFNLEEITTDTELNKWISAYQ